VNIAYLPIGKSEEEKQKKTKEEVAIGDRYQEDGEETIEDGYQEETIGGRKGAEIMAR
jgi:hypothetical protein